MIKDNVWFAFSLLEFLMLIGMIYVWDGRCKENKKLKDKINYLLSH